MTPQTTEPKDQTQPAGTVLFADDMARGWQDNWFLDGDLATVEHRDGGLYYAAGTVTKSQDPENYHAHHAVLWTKRSFEGDLRISYEFTRLDDVNYGNLLLYIQAQGIGTPPYVKDIYEWRDLRRVPIMSTYFNHMSLLHISFNGRLHARRYPADEARGITLADTLLGQRQEGIRIEPGRPYRVIAEKRHPMLSFRILDGETGEVLQEAEWDVTTNPEEQVPRIITEGRIGLRQMSTKRCIYRNFVVSRP